MESIDSKHQKKTFTCEGYCPEFCCRYIESVSLLVSVGEADLSLILVLQMMIPRLMMMRMKIEETEQRMIIIIMFGPSLTNSLGEAPGY